MHAATIQIMYVNPPKSEKGPGSIRDTKGVFYTVWGELNDKFVGAEGQTVTINYKTGEYNGKPQHTVLGIAGTTKGMPPARPSPVAVDRQVSPPPAPKPDYDLAKRREENIVMQATLKVYQGQLQLGDRQALISAWRMIRSAWRELQTGDARPSFKEDFNDELPSFEEPGKSLDETF